MDGGDTIVEGRDRVIDRDGERVGVAFDARERE